MINYLIEDNKKYWCAKQAFEDGCDYIVWHDIDMIPEEGGNRLYLP